MLSLINQGTTTTFLWLLYRSACVKNWMILLERLTDGSYHICSSQHCNGVTYFVSVPFD